MEILGEFPCSIDFSRLKDFFRQGTEELGEQEGRHQAPIGPNGEYQRPNRVI